MGIKIDFKSQYKLYKSLLKNHSTNMSKNLGKEVTIIPTSKRICRKNGVTNAATNSINTADILNKYIGC